MKNLPLGIQNLNEIIKGDYLYVDKTDLFPELIKYKQIFLSRPRRFGKSLLLNSLEQLFRGNADLFSGLKIADSGYEFKKYPVIRLSMTVDCDTPKILKEELINNLKGLTKPYNDKKDKTVKLRSRNPGGALKHLIEDISEKCGERVVVLIDEYDYPVSKYISDIALAKANTDILSSFYIGLKDMDEFLRFVMVTGVTRYAMMGLSAGLNQLVDLSFDPKYAAICGFTPNELDQYFGDRYDSALDYQKSIGKMPTESSIADLRQKILDWYDGYTWDGRTRVLNPISLLNFFNLSYFKGYWNSTAPSYVFLKSAITENTLSVLKIDRQGYSEEDLSLISVGHLATVPLLFHTGYLTIDKVTEVDGKDQYFFKVPNFELKDRFYKVLKECAKERLYINDLITEAAELNKALRERDDELLTQIIGVLFHRIPAEHYEKNERLGESFFHMALLCYCSGLLEARAEEPGPLGDLDLLLITSDGLHAVIELKYAQSPDPTGPMKTLSKLVKKALSVIKKKKYGARYRLPGQEIVPIGLGVVGRGEAKAVFGDPQRDPA